MTDHVLNLPDDTRMLDVVRQGLATADDVRIAVSFTRCSGLGLLVDPLKDLVERGGASQDSYLYLYVGNATGSARNIVFVKRC